MLWNKRKKFLLVVFVLLISFALISIPLIMWIRFDKPSPMRIEVEIFVNYEDNDVGIDVVPEGLNFNWYLDGTIIESGVIDATGMLSFPIIEPDGVYILELGKEQFQESSPYKPLISNYTFVYGTFYDEIEIGAKHLVSYLLWEGGMPIDTQNVDLWMLNKITSSYDIFVGTYMTDSLGYVNASVVEGGYTWKVGDILPISPESMYMYWHLEEVQQQFIFALKVVRGFIVIVVLEEKAMITILVFLFDFGNKK